MARMKMKNEQNQSFKTEESESKNGTKFRKRFHKERDVDKEITFMQEKKRDKKQPGDREYFLASACESTKCLPHHL
jgi:hypothetical protein